MLLRRSCVRQRPELVRLILLERLLGRPHSSALHARKIGRRRLRRVPPHLLQRLVDLLLEHFDPCCLLASNFCLLLMLSEVNIVERGVGVAGHLYRLQLDRVVLGLRL